MISAVCAIMCATSAAIADFSTEIGFEFGDALLERGDTLLQFQNLGANGHLVEFLVYGRQPRFDSLYCSFQCLAFAFEPIETLEHRVEIGEHLVAERYNAQVHHALDIRQR